MFDPGFNLLAYSLDGTMYGAVGKTQYICWETCRELFHDCFFDPYSDLYRQDGFLFCVPRRHAAAELENVCGRLARLEERLGLSRADRMVSHSTAAPNVLWFEFGPFWYSRVRLEFLTAFIRSAKLCRFANCDAVLKGGKYLKTSRPATERFLSGHTTMAKDAKFAGWHKTFKNLTEKKVAELLV